ncbi:MAG: hypothetical protein H7Y36_11185 [Armatimonadetes bacterium]|nr:hypothetical protein [Akkermansiaceae bacterium]
MSEELDQLSEKADQEEVAVLFIGNSYSAGIGAAFGKLANSRGKRVRVGSSTRDGWNLKKHANHAPTLEKLRSGRWDIVVIQDYSLISAMKEKQRARLMDPPVRFFVTAARAMGAVPLLYQTWGRRDGDPSIQGDGFHAMNDRVREGYRAASRNAGGVIIVPAGDAWEREFEAGRGSELYVDDGSHPSAYGNSVTAEAFYKVIFKE